MALARRRKRVVIAKDEMQSERLRAGATSVSFGDSRLRVSPFEFGNLGLQPTHQSDLALAFFRYSRHRSPHTRVATYGSLRTFAVFLRTNHPPRYSDRMLDFYAYLESGLNAKGEIFKVNHRIGIYDCVRLALENIMERPLVKYLATTLPHAPHRRSRRSRSPECLSEIEEKRVLDAAKAEIRAARERPPELVTKRLLIPYAVLIGARTWANSHALFSLLVDCLEPHPLDDRRTVINWRKPRSKRRQYRSFRTDRDFDPPQLVNELIRLTAPIRAVTSPSDRNMLFIGETIKYGRPWRGPSSVNYNHIDNLLNEFIRAHNLPKFTFRTLRVTGIRGTLKATRNVRVVQKLANHERRVSTVEYASERDTIEICNEFISDIQREYRGFLLSDISDAQKMTKTLDIDKETAKAIQAGRNASLSGFNCKNPMEGKAPGTKAGELCINYLACFTCENAVLGNDVRSAARLIQFRDAIIADEPLMRPERYDYLYRWVVEQLNTRILPLYDRAILMAAIELAKTLPVLPSFAQ